MSIFCITAGEKLPEQAILTQVLAKTFGLDRDTAAARARHCWGVLGREAAEPEAGELGRLCEEFGVATLKFPAPPPPLPAPEQIKKCSFGNGALSFSSEGAAYEAAPGDISVLAAAPIKETFMKTVKSSEGPSNQEKAVRFGIMAVTGLPIGMGKSKEVSKEVKSFDLSFYLDILLVRGPRRFRVASADFDFSCLKEKKTYSSQVNFRQLAVELAAFAPGAFKNTGLLAMLAGKPLTMLPYDSLADLELETLRLALAAGAGR